MLVFIIHGILIGVGATIVLDVWIALLKRLFGMPSRNWALVGRWVGHFPRGQFIHQSIAATAPVRGELALGWAFHYFVGAAHGILPLAIWGAEWGRRPTLFPALAVGLLMLVAPFFVMEPALGSGIAASRTPNPTASRLRSLMNHTVFGLGLYLAAWAVVPLYAP